MARTSAPKNESVESVVRHYFSVVADLTSTEDHLRPLLAEDLRVTEHPNAITPEGAVRNRDQVLAGFRAGKALLTAQEFEVKEVITSGDQAAVRAVWRATIGVDAGPYRTGMKLIANIAAFLTVRAGIEVEHETFDFYEPFGR